MERKYLSRLNVYSDLIKGIPEAFAVVEGSENYPKIYGLVGFCRTKQGVLVFAEMSGLPTDNDPCKSPVLAFHIHSGEKCEGDMHDHFSKASTHYNPHGCDHPYHAGDLPPIFSNNGYAFSTFITNRFSLDEIIGKTVILHRNPDDFTTQPSGNAGEKIACGMIKRIKKQSNGCCKR